MQIIVPDPIISHGRSFDGVYEVVDWFEPAYFIGHKYKSTESGKTSHQIQTDHRIERPFTADALFPDGTIHRVVVSVTGCRRGRISDHGGTYDTSWNIYGVKTSVHGAEVIIPVTSLRFDVLTIEEIA